MSVMEMGLRLYKYLKIKWMKFKFKANSVYNRWLVWCSMDGSNFSESVRNLTAKFKQSEMFFLDVVPVEGITVV